MGVSYLVMPLEPKMKEWLADHGIAYPKGATARAATPREIRAATTDLEGFAVTYNGADDFKRVDIESLDEQQGYWTTLDISERGGLDDPADFHFEKGWAEALIPVLIRLSAVTGPLVMVADIDGVPALITPDKSVAQVIEEWAQASEAAEDEDSTDETDDP